MNNPENPPFPSPLAKARPARSRNARAPSRRRGYLGLGGAVLLVLALYLAMRPRPLAVEIATIDRGPLSVSVLEEGKTRIRNRYVVSAPLAGQLLRTTLRPGDRLEANQTVVATLETQPAGFLDPRARAQSEAAVDAAAAAVQLREAEISRAGAAVDLMLKERQRASDLLDGGTISIQEWDRVDAETTFRERELRAAEFARHVAQFELNQARAALLQAHQPPNSTNLLFQIRAPVDGLVLNVYEESSRIVPPGTPLMEVGDPRDLEVELELLSQDAVSVKPGAALLIERWGGPEALRGRASVVEPAAYTKISALGVEEQRVKVRADFIDPPPAEHSLGDRFRIEARVITWQADDVLRIPTGALFRRGGGWMCFVAEDGRTRLKRVTIGHNSGVHAEVLEGVVAGDLVIVHPPDVVVEGVKVRARRPDGS